MEKDAVSTSKVLQPIIVHLDVDAFYVACERELRPELRSRPVGVSQYNPYGDLRDCAIDDPARILYDGHAAAAQNQQNKNPNVNGSLIAVSYEARARNVKRNDRGLEAVSKCPELCIVQVPVMNGKANLNIYRDASERLLTALAKFMKTSSLEVYQQVVSFDIKGNSANGPTKNNADNSQHSSIKVEKASVDEIYIDITVPVSKIVEACKEYRNWNNLYEILTAQDSASTHTTIGGLETSEAAIATNSLSKSEIRKGSSLQVLDSKDAASLEEDKAGKAWWGRKIPDSWSVEELSLAVGALITLKARQAIMCKFDGVFTLSAGISTNKVMAKLASGLKKPNRQTLISPSDETALQKLFHPLPLGRIRGLGGKFGQLVEDKLQVKTVGELAKTSKILLLEHFEEKQAEFLFRIAQGICDEEVAERTKAKSIGAGKTFLGVLAIRSSDHEKLKKWLGNLVADIMNRFSSDPSRYAKTLTCSLSLTMGSRGKQSRHASQSASLPRKATAMKCNEIAFKLARGVIESESRRKDISGSDILMVTGIRIAATNFVTVETGSSSILDAFQRSQNTPGSSMSPSQSISGRQTKSSVSTKSKVKGITSCLMAPAPSVDEGKNALKSSVETVTNDSTVDGSHSAALTPRQHNTPPVMEMDAMADLEVARTLQQQYGKENTTSDQASKAGKETKVSRELMPTRSCVKAPEAPDAAKEEVCISSDPDLEYAKQLQASFDRENEVISCMEQRRTSISKHNDKKRRSRSKSSGRPDEKSPSSLSISSFFVKKAK